MLAGRDGLVDSVWKDLGLDFDEKARLEDLATNAELQADWDELNEILVAKNANWPSDNGSAMVSRPVLSQALSELSGSTAHLAGVFNCVAANLKLGPGEVRLIGYTDQKLDQSKYNPAATQANHNLLVVVHLRHADLPECGPDVNAVSDFIRGRSNVDVDEENNSLIGENYIDGTQPDSE